MAKSPKEIFTEFIQKENPEATLWDIFMDYSLIFPENASADTSEEWLREQEKIINTIVTSYLANIQLTRIQIEDLCCAIQEFTFGEEEQFIDYLDASLLPIAKKIATEKLLTKQLTEATISIFLDHLQNRLEKTNETHILKSDQDAMRKMMLDLPYYSEEKKLGMVKNLEKVWEMNPNGTDTFDESLDDDVEDEIDDNEREGYLWPEIGLAYSQTFYGFDDAGNLSYEEQEKLARKKYDVFVTEITELLGEEPNSGLFPVNLKTSNRDLGLFESFSAEYPLVYEFENQFTLWKGEDSVLFLILRKEDKELPYQSVLGGMELKEYKRNLEAYAKFQTGNNERE